MSSENQIDQPIDIWKSSCDGIFNEIRKELLVKYPQSDIKNIPLIWRSEQRKLSSPYCNSWFISVQNTFLSFLWSYSYGIIILMPGKEKEIEAKDHEQAHSLLNYAKSLFSEFSVWDENLPSPDMLANNDSKQFIGKVNGFFITAFNFIIYHEFAHIILGHTKEENVSLERKLEMEQEADEFAEKNTMEKVKGDTTIQAIGIITALCSLTFSNSKFKGYEHPDPDQRLLDSLNRLNFPDDNIIWGFASWAILQWQLKFQQFGFPDNYISMKHYFLDLFKFIEKFKSYN